MQLAYFPTSILVIFIWESLAAEGDRCASSSIDHRTLEKLVSKSLLKGERPNVFYFSLKIF